MFKCVYGCIYFYLGEIRNNFGYNDFYFFLRVVLGNDVI